MKKLFLLFILLNVCLYSQPNEQILKLKSELDNIPKIEQAGVPEINNQKKNAGLAILYSILLPGMGELYAGDYSTGKYFTMADIAFWGAFTGMTIYGSNKEDDYKAYAKSIGGVDLKDKDKEYFANIGLYLNINDYNNEKDLNRQFTKVYNSKTHYWDWLNESNRKEYRSLWKSSENAKNNVRFAVGALVLNRIVSAIFAAKAVSSHNKKIDSEMSWKVNFDYVNELNLPSKLVMNFSHRL